MKAIILERRGEWAAALREDGVVVKARTGAQVGETIELSAAILNLPDFNSRWVRTAAAAVLVLALAGGSFNYYNTAVAASYVSVDVGDSSVELSVNRLGRVIGVTALNDESEELAETLRAEIRQKKVDDAVDRTMARLQESGGLTGEEDVILGVTGESSGQSTRLAEAVERGMEKTRERHDDMNIYTLKGDRNQRNEAQKHGMSPGRFFAMNDTQGNSPEGHGPKPPQPTAETQTTESAQPRETQAAAIQTPPTLPDSSQPPAPPSDGPTESPAESGVPAVGPGPQPSGSAAPAPSVRPTQAPTPTARPAQTARPVQTQRPVQTPPPPPSQSAAPVETPPPPPTPTPAPAETPTPPAPTQAPVETPTPPVPTQAPVETPTPPAPTQAPSEPTQAPPAPTQEQPPQPGPFDGPPGKLVG